MQAVLFLFRKNSLNIILNDTPEHIRKKQLEIIHSKTPWERFMMGIEMAETTYQMSMNLVKKRNPELHGEELIKAFIRFYYKDDFTPEQLNRMLEK